MSITGSLFARLVPYLPSSFVAATLRRRSWLWDRVPAGQSIRWPYYQDDLVVHVDRTNAIEWTMVLGYDPDIIRAVHRFVKPGAYCIDVGANVGAVTLPMAKLAGPEGRVLAVEPGPRYVERLRQNLAANPSFRDRVTILNVGLSDRAGTLVWRPDPEHSFNAGLSPIFYPDSVPNEVTVPVMTLDAAIEGAGWTRVDFVKIDVEGMELDVFRGAEHTMTVLRPVVLFETLDPFRIRGLGTANEIDAFAAIEQLLGRWGYRLCDVEVDGTLRAVTLASLPYNTVAVPNERF